MLRLFILAGEVSGDKLGGSLALELVSRGYDVAGWGGQEMASAGVTITQDIQSLNFMGFSDVIMKLPTITRLLNQCKRDIEKFNPDILVLIDFGSFNFRVAKWAKNRIKKIVYYSPPKLWASRPGRSKFLKKYCDQVIVLFPFEQSFYQSHDIQAEYYGHPLVERIQQVKSRDNFRQTHDLDDRPIIALLPGSRKQEIIHHLPIYLAAVKHFPEYTICVSSAPGMHGNIKNICDKHSSEVLIIKEDLYQLLSNSNLAIITSGTASLEAALLRIPQVVCYKTSWLNYWIARSIIRVPYISLVNLIIGSKIVEELIQEDCNEPNLRNNIISLIDSNKQSDMAYHYDHLINELSKEEITKRTALAIIG